MKLNKKLGTLLASAGLLSTGLFATAGQVQAADLTQALSGATTVTVGQENGAESDDTHITNDAETDTGTGTSTAGIGWAPGHLVLNQVPNFDFGTGHTLHGGQLVYPLLSTAGATGGTSVVGDAAATSGARALVVSDQRADKGETEGWNVTLKLNNFEGKDSQGSAASLPSDTVNPIKLNLFAGESGTAGTAEKPVEGEGAYITAATWNPANATNTPATPIYQFDKSTTRDDRPNAVLPTDIIAGATDAIAIWDADAGKGAGTWGLNFDSVNSAKLTVPDASQKVGTWTAQMDWTLTSGPIS